MLTELVASHFDRSDPESVLGAVYTGELAYGRLFELARVCLEAAAGGDEVATGAVDALADEVVAMVTATTRRLGIVDEGVEVVLGGGLFDSEYAAFGGRVETGIRTVVPRARFRHLDAAPVLGAALLALDQVRAPGEAAVRLRREAPSRGVGPN